MKRAILSSMIRLTWFTGIVAALLGAVILAVFWALLNYLTPTGRIVVAARVVEVTPNVTGEVIAIPVKPNIPVKAGAILFQLGTETTIGSARTTAFMFAMFQAVWPSQQRSPVSNEAER